MELGLSKKTIRHFITVMDTVKYCEETMGIWVIMKYLLSWSSVTVVPARRAEATAAAGFMKNISRGAA